MKLLIAIKALLGANKVWSFSKFISKADKVESDLKKKIKAGKASEVAFSDYNIFKDGDMTKGLNQLKKILKAAKKANSIKHEWPDDKFTKLYNAAVKSIKSKGPEHKDTKAAIDKYHTALALTIVNLAAANKRLVSSVKVFDQRIKDATLTRKYMSAFEKELLKIVVVVPATSMQAQFFTLSQEAKQMSRTAADIQTAYKKLQKKVKALIKEGEFRISDLKTRAEYVSDGGLQNEFG